MMTIKKLYDLAVVVDEYTDRDGNQKKKYLNVGVAMEKTYDNGDRGKFLLLDRTFNPAGVPNPDGRANVAINLFAPCDNNNNGNGGQQNNNNNNGGQQQNNGGNDNNAGNSNSNNNFDDEIPF